MIGVAAADMLNSRSKNLEICEFDPSRGVIIGGQISQLVIETP